MAVDLDFFFDFLSPFAYLAHKRLVRLCSEHKVTLNYKPIDLPRAKLAAGNTGPSNRTIPVKIRYLMTDINRWAVKSGLPVHFPKGLDSARMNKGAFLAIERNVATRYVDGGFRLGWGQGDDLNDDDTLRRLAGEMGWPADEFLAFVASPEAEAAYEAVNREAHARGVFGVPTMLIGEEMWWGNDRLDFLAEYLAKTVPA